MLLDVQFKIDYSNIYSILVSALEGGSNYWYFIKNEIKPVNFDNTPDDKQFIQCYPLNKGGALMIDDSQADEPELKQPVKLDLKRIEMGLRLMALNSPRHFTDFLNEDDDATTADVFLQYCIFGEVIYG